MSNCLESCASNGIHAAAVFEFGDVNQRGVSTILSPLIRSQLCGNGGNEDTLLATGRPIDASGVTSQSVCIETSLDCAANHHHELPAAQTNSAAAVVMAHTRRRCADTRFRSGSWALSVSTTPTSFVFA